MGNPIIDEDDGCEETLHKVSNHLAGKTVESVSDMDDHGDTHIVFRFTAGTRLQIRYSHIYHTRIYPPDANKPK